MPFNLHLIKFVKHCLVLHDDRWCRHVSVFVVDLHFGMLRFEGGQVSIWVIFKFTVLWPTTAFVLVNSACCAYTVRVTRNTAANGTEFPTKIILEVNMNSDSPTSTCSAMIAAPSSININLTMASNVSSLNENTTSTTSPRVTSSAGPLGCN